MSRSLIVISSAIALMTTACGTDEKLPSNISQTENNYLITPLSLTGDTTEYYVADFVPTFNSADSITSSAPGLKIIKGEGEWENYYIVKSAETPSLFTIDLWSQGNLVTQTVIDREGQDPKKVPVLYSKSITDARMDFVSSEAPSQVIALWQNVLIPASYITIDGEAISIRIPLEAEKVINSSIRLYALTSNGATNDVTIPLVNGRVITSSENLSKGDSHKKVLYSLMIDRFADGNPANNRKLNRPDVLPIVDYMGGDFAGITQKIKDGFFANLGINTIWISPITQNPEDAWGLNKNPETRFSGYHGYWPIYTTVVDNRFGTEDELREMLATAHEHGMEVILDYVANHLHINSPVLKANPDWVTPLELPDGRRNLELWDEHRLTTWFDVHIPTLDLGRKDIYQPMTDSAIYWLHNFDFDGFRHDATKHIPSEYWRTLTAKVRKEFPERNLYQIGETYGSPSLINSYVRSGMLDGQFDFNVYDATVRNIITPEGSFEELDKTIRESLLTYGYNNLMGYISGNHDRPRFISLAGGSLTLEEDAKAAGWTRDITVGDSSSYAKLELLEAIMMSLPGVPCIYQGDEYGIPGGNDPDNRHMMQFEGYSAREASHRDAVASLIKQRTSNMALIYGTYVPLYSDRNLLVFARTYMGQTTVAAFNRGNENRSVEVTLPSSSEKIKIELPAFGYTHINK